MRYVMTAVALMCAAAPAARKVREWRRSRKESAERQAYVERRVQNTRI